jgi:hypothetical protein
VNGIHPSSRGKERKERKKKKKKYGNLLKNQPNPSLSADKEKQKLNDCV